MMNFLEENNLLNTGPVHITNLLNGIVHMYLVNGRRCIRLSKFGKYKNCFLYLFAICLKKINLSKKRSVKVGKRISYIGGFVPRLFPREEFLFLFERSLPRIGALVQSE